MQFKPILKYLLIAGLCVCLSTGELWLRHGLAAQKSRIAFAHLGNDNFEIYVMDADGGNRENLSNHPLHDMEPDWSPDGTKIAFVSNRSGGTQIHIMDADGKNQIRLTDGPREKREPDWSPDGGKIAFTVQDVFLHIDVMDADGNNRMRLVRQASAPSWSPDGQQIAFVSSRNWDSEIHVVGPDGQGLERVKHGLHGASPSFSPDGGRFAYYESHKGIEHIYVVGVDGKNPERLTHDQGRHSHPTWSPDGGAIAYVVSKNDFPLGARIHLMTANGKHLKQLSNIREGIDYQPDFSPGGLAVSPASKTATIWGRLKKTSSSFR